MWQLNICAWVSISPVVDWVRLSWIFRDNSRSSASFRTSVRVDQDTGGLPWPSSHRVTISWLINSGLWWYWEIMPEVTVPVLSFNSSGPSIEYFVPICWNMFIVAPDEVLKLRSSGRVGLLAPAEVEAVTGREWVSAVQDIICNRLQLASRLKSIMLRFFGVILLHNSQY